MNHHLSTAERVNWNAAHAHSNAAHAPTNAQANAAIATTAQAQAGTNNTATMTPLRVSEAISALSSSGGTTTVIRGYAVFSAGPDMQTINVTLNGINRSRAFIAHGNIILSEGYNPVGEWVSLRLTSNTNLQIDAWVNNTRIIHWEVIGFSQ